MLNDLQIARLMSKKILFGHQSVGNNILKGITDLTSADPRLKLNIVRSSDPQLIAGPALVEFSVGQNGDPQSKIDAFTAVLDKWIGTERGIAMFKFCYVDIERSTDIAKVAAAYGKAIRALKGRHPSVQIVHVTVPLSAEEPRVQARIKRLMRRTTRAELNVKRNEFNDVLRKTYAASDPIFDLAAIESTHADGSRCFFPLGNNKVYTLVPEYTEDGGHLNELGRRLAAEELLRVLAEAETGRP
jgi:lysophospholipase L1-like esterase